MSDDPKEASTHHDTLSELIAARGAVERAIQELIEPQTRSGAISANTHIDRAREFLNSASGRLGGSPQADLYTRVALLEQATLRICKDVVSRHEELEEDLNALDKRTRGLVK